MRYGTGVPQVNVSPCRRRVSQRAPAGHPWHSPARPGPRLLASRGARPLLSLVTMASDVTTTDPAARDTTGRRARSEVVVARRFLDHGFIDAAMRIFERQARQVTADDWNRLVDRLLERGRIVDVVRTCQVGDVP